MTPSLPVGLLSVPVYSVSVRAYERTRRVADTAQGELIRHHIRALERLILAYEEGALLEAGI